MSVSGTPQAFASSKPTSHALRDDPEKSTGTKMLFVNHMMFAPFESFGAFRATGVPDERRDEARRRSEIARRALQGLRGAAEFAWAADPSGPVPRWWREIGGARAVQLDAEMSSGFQKAKSRCG